VDGVYFEKTIIKIDKMRTLSFIFITLFCSCSISKKIANDVNKLIINDSALLNANVGISIYDVATNQYLYNHNGNKYLVPASNTKIATCYAAMKYLGDSLIGLRYLEEGDKLLIQGTGDPSFLMEEFAKQPVEDFLRKSSKSIVLNTDNWKETALGNGWMWGDFTEDYCQERSVLPLYYNTVKWQQKPGEVLKSTPKLFEYYVSTNIEGLTTDRQIKVMRMPFENKFIVEPTTTNFTETNIPFVTSDSLTSSLLLIHFRKPVYLEDSKRLLTNQNLFGKIYSQPTDSILKPMMHRSDNFFAEQSLLMVSNEKLGYMNDVAIIDYIKKNDFVGIPQMPRWVDGSGMSRYNLFTPQSLVWILNKMRNEFGMPRIKNVFATVGEGTLKNLLKKEKGFIYAKTGTLSNHAALSGFLYTKKNKLIIFSILTSGYQGSAIPVRKAIEKLLLKIRETY
jgi:serine-type D-Ala-D-Ala carboxypeptidase/endopeptidase (penicillin-binding protein 4)